MKVGKSYSKITDLLQDNYVRLLHMVFYEATYFNMNEMNFCARNMKGLMEDTM